MALSARDNFFKECPAVMDYSAMTDYRVSQRRDQYIKRLNNVTNDYDYKDFLQQNASKILDAEWQFNKINYGCHPNQCIFNATTSPPPGTFSAELKRYNDVRVRKNYNAAQCPSYEDSRACAQ
jgi:hypothetical protein